MGKNKKWFQDFNRERLLLTALVAISFFGFLLWSIEQVSQEETLLLSTIISPFSSTENEIIKIISPKINEAIKSPIKISGQAATAGSALQARIKDASGLVLAQKEIRLKAGQKVSFFNAEIIFKKPTRPRGTLEIFIRSPKNNAETDKLMIPVIFKN